VNLHIHAKDVLLKPWEFLEFPSNSPGSSILSVGGCIGASIPHKGVWASSGSSGVLAVLAAQLGTPRGRCDEHSGKFPSIVKSRFNRPVGERNHFWRLMLAGFWQGALSASAATWNQHTTQPKYFAPTSCPRKGDDPIGGTGRQRERRVASVPLWVCPRMGRGLLLRPGRKLSPDPLFFFWFLFLFFSDFLLYFNIFCITHSIQIKQNPNFFK
jgi:hypothetical protein